MNTKSIKSPKSFLVAFVILLGLFFQSAIAANFDFEINRLQYKINDDGNSVTLVTYRLEPKQYGPTTLNILPEVTYGGKAYYVTALADNAFTYFLNLETVNLPSTITSIGNKAFSDCRNLADINIPNSVTSIGSSAFSGCERLASITLPETITIISDFMFCGCGLQNFTIPSKVTSIGKSAFQYCSGLRNIELPNSV
ncbi:MAG: leucine-rich repeat domain-containing protein, partial [Muribaculaceae bacterium]|nr:leucine-rich repeat domain-containing protein [Muribaculaceae bacterium]